VVCSENKGRTSVDTAMASFRSRVDDTWVTHAGVRFEVTEYAAEPVTDPWDVTVYGTVDSPPRFGVGLGYIIGYSCEGDYRGRTFASRGYMAYVDRESVDRARPGFPTGATG
jgi:hypothetical protein